MELKIIENTKARVLSYEKGQSIYEVMRNNNVYFSAACGGKGKCGKCKIQVLEGALEVTPTDASFFTQEELDAGYRLSCRAYPKESSTFRLAVGNESDFEVLTEYENQEENGSYKTDHAYVIGIDIGTTTIAVHLVGRNSKRVVQSFSTINKQRAYGADVISRIQASNDGKINELRESIRKDLMAGIREVIEKAEIEKSQVMKIAIAGNTTMIHLLMGYSCETLGIHPFTPVNIHTIELPFEEILGADYLQISVVLLPGISTFVGGDIVAGLLTCELEQSSKPCLLVDLGTNGEMAIGNKDKIIVTSTAAGPAFEGGNISQGIGSVAGAICNVTIEGDKIEYKTIGGKTPVGICGTGVIEITGELVSAGLIDETGLLDEEYFEEGFEIAKGKNGESIAFTQKDIREIQLAKSAIRAGVETLLINYQVSYGDIGTVYIAGGFGHKLNLEKAVRIGMFPEEFLGKMKAIGNSSLSGAIKYLVDEKAVEKTQKIIDISHEISLASDKNFNDFYMEHMFF